MAYFTAEIDISVEEFYEEMSKSEKIEMLDLLRNDGFIAPNKDLYLSSMIRNCSDIEVLTNKKFLSTLVYFMKYECSDLLEFMKEELNG